MERFTLESFFLIFLLQRCILHLLADLNILFYHCGLHYNCFRQLICDTLDCLCNRSMQLCCSCYSSRQQIVCTTNIFALNFPRHIFFVGQAVYFSKITQFYWFCVFSCQFNVVTVINCGVFITFMVNQRYFYLVNLSIWAQKIDSYWIRLTAISYVFRMDDRGPPFLKLF